MALEALHPGYGPVAMTDGLFWMLKSSIVRTLGGRSMLGPATEPRGFAESPVNTLIIEADASGFVKGVGYLPPLANVSVECQDLSGIIERRRREGGAFNEVIRFAPGPVPATWVSPRGFVRRSLSDNLAPRAFQRP